MKKPHSLFAAGIFAGVAAAFVLPKVAQEFVRWAKTPAGKKTLSEWIPPEDQKQITSMWNQRQDLWQEGVTAVKKRMNTEKKQSAEPSSVPKSKKEKPVRSPQTAKSTKKGTGSKKA